MIDDIVLKLLIITHTHKQKKKNYFANICKLATKKKADTIQKKTAKLVMIMLGKITLIVKKSDAMSTIIDLLIFVGILSIKNCVFLESILN